MPRNKSSQGTHDRKVSQIANELRNKGYKVQADVSGFNTPDRIGKSGHIPDVVATRDSKTKIIEVDTPGTENQAQLSTFRRSAAHRENADFEHVITKPRK
jgi:Holliday junction resolvase